MLSAVSVNDAAQFPFDEPLTKRIKFDSCVRNAALPKPPHSRKPANASMQASKRDLLGCAKGARKRGRHASAKIAECEQCRALERKAAENKYPSLDQIMSGIAGRWQGIQGVCEQGEGPRPSALTRPSFEPKRL